ncbi:MAG: tRNA (adenosine(37)-N6)-threonylcarbamoyltransferase complex transferase subunit TsaD [Clostridia bacterium]|nr:tRNA (adenosine(37)-N6)-threonylcarbamoyltransferase complex transferase subunit TsaD [Clostridia bacterium]
MKAGGDTMLILGIETSCDETSAAVINHGNKILSNVISSQISTHQPYGGVVPEIASRKHLENIIPVISEAMDQADVSFKELDAIAVTYGPGLAGALLVGVSAAKALAYSLGKPLIGVNHLDGHIYASFLEHTIQMPLVCLVVSGGHTSLVYMEDHDQRNLLGATRDDAAGEVFDKIARKMNLGYPGGPIIEKMALEGQETIDFPRAWLEPDSLDFSFSGLKTSVINYLHKKEQIGEEINVPDIAASFQKAIFEVLVTKTIGAAETKNVKSIVLAGGVAANSYFKNWMTQEAGKKGIKVYYPSPVLCTDNAAMIACAGYYNLLKGKTANLDLNAVPNLQMELEM